MRIRNLLVPFMMTSMLSAAALANESGFTLGTEFQLLNWSSVSAETKPEAGDKTTTASTMMSSALVGDGYLSFGWDKALVYVYPFADKKMFTLGWMVMENLEVDLDLGLNSAASEAKTGDVKVKSSSNSTSYALGAIYGIPVGASTLEVAGKYGMGTSTAKEDSVKSKDMSSTRFELGATYVCPVAKKLQYVGGLTYSMDSSKNKLDKSSEKANALTLRLFGLRAQI